MQLIEHYLSIQGEGLHPGKLAYFVRFARCNLRCSWCDSDYTFGPGKKISFSAVVSAIRKSKASYVCLTGGEPLLHEQDCIRLIQHFPKIHFDIETGGSLPIEKVQLRNTSVIMDWKLHNSKMTHKMRKENFSILRPRQDLLKLVTDFSKIERREIIDMIRSTEKYRFPISIQPVYGTNLQKLAEWVIGLKNPRLQMNIQIQKYIWHPAQRGV